MNSKQVNDTVNRLVSFMGDIKDGNLREILANMQKMCDYQPQIAAIPKRAQELRKNGIRLAERNF